jgi:integrase
MVMRKSPCLTQRHTRAMQIALIAPRPLDALEIPAALDGRDGINRTPGRRQIAANDDLSAIRAWLARVVETKTTFENYRKKPSACCVVTRRDRQAAVVAHARGPAAYQRFLADPQPRGAGSPAAASSATIHVGGRSTVRSPHQPASGHRDRQRPVRLARRGRLPRRQPTRSHASGTARRAARDALLERDLWQEVKVYIDSLPRETDRERERYWRARWLFTLLYLGGLRITEVSTNTMGDFFCRRDADGHERWWLEITGKGKGAPGARLRRNDGRTRTLPARARSAGPAGPTRTHSCCRSASP